MVWATTEQRTDEYGEEARALLLLRESMTRLSTHVSEGRIDFPELDPGLRWQVFVGDILRFSRSNAPSFHFVSSCAASTMGYANQQAMIDAGGFSIMRQNYKKLECIFWVHRLLALPHARGVQCIDYIAHTKLRKPGGRMGFELRRYLACNLVGYRGAHDIICASFDPRHIDREAWVFAVSTHPDPNVRRYATAVHCLCSGRRRLEVFILRTRMVPPHRIAERLGISVHVVNEHMTEAYRALGFTDRKLQRAVAFAKDSGLRSSSYYEPAAPVGGASEANESRV